jgi:chromosome segregation ATPase
MLAKLQGLQDAKKPLEIKQNEINEIKNRVKKELNDVKNEISFLEDKKYDLIKNRAELSKKYQHAKKCKPNSNKKYFTLVMPMIRNFALKAKT